MDSKKVLMTGRRWARNLGSWKGVMMDDNLDDKRGHWRDCWMGSKSFCCSLDDGRCPF